MLLILESATRFADMMVKRLPAQALLSSFCSCAITKRHLRQPRPGNSAAGFAGAVKSPITEVFNGHSIPSHYLALGENDHDAS